MNLKPIANRIIVKTDVEPTENKTDSGIILAIVVKETQNKGTVIAKGTEVHLVKVDDYIYYSKHAGIEIKVNNIPYLIMNQEDVLAIIKKDESCT